MSLQTLGSSVQKLQNSLQTKAKTEPGFRFYSLWDKVCRTDVLHEAWRRCRANGGSAGVDGEAFEDIEARGLEAWLGNLQQELRADAYRTQPLLRVWIPKSNGGQRPLGIPTIRDRVAQAAAVLVLSPIFEGDLPDEMHGYRPGRSAKTALRRVHHEVQRAGRVEVVDADLSDYFNTIPHAALMKSVARRVSDGRMLAVAKQWLVALVVERTRRSEVRTNEAKRKKRGTPQGGVISPLLANLYFRRFILGWHQTPAAKRGGSVVVNYADDLVICCFPGQGDMAMSTMRTLMTRLGLTVNDRKTRLVRLPEEPFDFLGYTIQRCYRRDGKSYIGTVPSRRARRKLMVFIREQTSPKGANTEPVEKVRYINRTLRGWAAYFDMGPVAKICRQARVHVEQRLRRWLMRRRKKRGSGYRQYPVKYLYETLGLYKLKAPEYSQWSAKV